MFATIKPRNARSKRAMEDKAPKQEENQKRTLFLRGTTASEILKKAMQDLNTLKAPHTIKFSKKNEVHPFEDATSLEFFSNKNDSSLLVFGSHTKKRPHQLTFIRTFDYQIFDMIELNLDPDTYLPLQSFKNKKVAIGMKPLILFTGSLFSNHPAYIHIRSMFLDFFRGPQVTNVDAEGLQYVVCVSAGEISGDIMSEVTPLPPIHLRVNLVQTKKSGQKLPRVELEEMGPRMDFKVNRRKEPEESMLKEAMKVPRGTKPRSKKNIETDIIGDKVARIHLGKQDLKTLQTRKMKGLKRGRDEVDGGESLPTNGTDSQTKRPKST